MKLDSPPIPFFRDEHVVSDNATSHIPPDAVGCLDDGPPVSHLYSGERRRRWFPEQSVDCLGDAGGLVGR
jgi:hypothetical protein